MGGAPAASGGCRGGVTPWLFINARCARLIEPLPALQHNPNRLEDVLKLDADIEFAMKPENHDSRAVQEKQKVSRRNALVRSVLQAL